MLSDDDIIIDGGNSYFPDDVRRAQSLKKKNIRYLDVGTSGGVWGRERGYCLMIGGESDAVSHLDPVFRTLAPGQDAAPATPGRENDKSTAHQGYLHCGGHGAGHFVKMVHNGIEYGVMAAYGEGFAMLHKARGRVRLLQRLMVCNLMPTPAKSRNCGDGVALSARGFSISRHRVCTRIRR